MGHTAFEYFQLLDGLGKVESLCTYLNTLFVATNDCSLSRYIIMYSSDKKKFSCSLYNQKKQFTKKPVTRMCSVSELGMLICLTDGCIKLFTLSMMREIDTIKNSQVCIIVLKWLIEF